MDLFSEVRLERTLEVLSTTDNDAAADVLLEALVHSQSRWQPRVLEALLKRRSGRAATEVLRRWGQLSTHQKHLVARRRGWISDALRGALTAAGETLPAACQAAREVGDYAQITQLVTVVMDSRSPEILEWASQTVLQLADRLREELNRTRDFRTRRGPHLQRSQIVSSLERAVRGFQRHGRREMIEALLLVADRRNATINHVLGDPSDRAFAPLLELLVASPRPGIMELLHDCLDDAQTPLAALHAVMRRRDARFVRLLCRRIGASPAITIRNNLKRVDQVLLMRQPSALLQMLDPEDQPGSVQLAQCSNIPRQQALEYVDRVLQEGSVSGRRCAAAVLASMEGAHANAVCQRTLADDDGEVIAAVARQLREREIPGAVQLLVGLLSSPLPDVRQAARDSLADISFERFLDRYDQSDDETRLAEGQLTLQVDSNFIGKLVMELQSSSRTHQRRGLEITLLLGLANQVEPTLAELAEYDDQYVRLEAIRLLAAMGTPLARGILRAAMHDKSALVQEAARQGLPDFDTAGSDFGEASAAVGYSAETAVREAVL